MGQYWQLIAPKKRQTLGHWGKLGECLFDGSPAALIALLAVPCLDWIDANDPATKDRHYLEPPYLYSAANRADFLSSDRAGGTSRFESLPPEIHSMIFRCLTSYTDALHLAVTTLQHWRIGRRYLKMFYPTISCQPANTPLICVGDSISTTPHDYPANLLSAAEIGELDAGVAAEEYEDCISGDEDDEQSGPVNLYALASARYSGMYTPEPEMTWPAPSFHYLTHKRLPLFHYNTIADSIRSFPAFEKAQAQSLARPVFEEFYPHDVEWVLRNLTTKEYVRADAVAVKPEYISGPVIKKIGFGEVILSRISWSSDHSSAMAYKGDITRGVWAGHCFDITTMAHMEADNANREWSDVGAEVAAEIADMWKSTWRKDWAEKLSSTECEGWP